MVIRLFRLFRLAYSVEVFLRSEFFICKVLFFQVLPLTVVNFLLRRLVLDILLRGVLLLRPLFSLLVKAETAANKNSTQFSAKSFLFLLSTFLFTQLVSIDQVVFARVEAVKALAVILLVKVSLLFLFLFLLYFVHNVVESRQTVHSKPNVEVQQLADTKDHWKLQNKQDP